jgi:hypothetical protein
LRFIERTVTRKNAQEKSRMVKALQERLGEHLRFTVGKAIPSPLCECSRQIFCGVGARAKMCARSKSYQHVTDEVMPMNRAFSATVRRIAIAATPRPR